MTKELLTLPNIKQDLKRIADFHISNAISVLDGRYSYMISVTLIGVVVLFFLKSVLIGILLFAVVAYHIVRYVMEYRNYREKKKQIAHVIDRGDISISVETLSHIANETIYEPHIRRRSTLSTRRVTFFHFVSGGSWRVPKLNKHYEWSREYEVSSKGLENISMKGDEFFYISLQGYPDVAYIYPFKNFALDDCLDHKDDA